METPNSEKFKIEVVLSNSKGGALSWKITKRPRACSCFLKRFSVVCGHDLMSQLLALLLVLMVSPENRF